MSFTVSAPGKIILSGEHAVVYGFKGIASSINLRCYATTKVVENPSDDDNKTISLHLQNLPFDFQINETEFNTLIKKVDKHGNDPTSIVYQSIMNEYLDEKLEKDGDIRDNEFIRQGLLVFIDLCLTILSDSWPQTALDITVQSEFSYGCGLGSSAAYSTVLAASLLLLGLLERRHGPPGGPIALGPQQLSTVSQLAFRGEQIVHGTPSGIDNCISTYGGALLFQRGAEEVLRRPVPSPHLPVLLVDTKVKRCTKTVVSDVQKSMAAAQDKYLSCFSQMDDIVQNVVNIISSGEFAEIDNSALNQLVMDNQYLLECIGVSHPSIEEAVAVLGRYGVAAKLTGAGRGGCLFAFVGGVEAEVLREASVALAERGYGVQVTHLSCPGVRVDFL